MEAVAEWPNAPVCGTGFRGFESRQSPEGLGSGKWGQNLDPYF